MSRSRNSNPVSAADRTINVARRLIYGNVVTSEFFARHWMKFFILLVLVMIYISTKYECMTKMEEIQRLERELSVAKTERIRQHSNYMSRTRESAMQQLVDTVIPGLAVQEQPPFHLAAE
ncbi:MAG: FtsL-like putative cell division protein [Muribaculaceae bacterium]|nr:FtsL-like putative cell division protein [Muribaculaceae bacterium]